MPSVSAWAVGFLLRTTGYYRRMYSAGSDIRQKLDKIKTARLAEPDRNARAKLDVTRSEFLGQPVWRFAPKDRAATATILFWHGGGYVYPPTSLHWAFVTKMAAREGWKIFAPCYPLAPESDADRTTAFAFAFYQKLIAKVDPSRLIMAGDSAGGGLTAATAMLVRDAGLTLPKGLMLFCPWLNLSPDHPDQRLIEPKDAILTLSGVKAAGALYAGNVGLHDPKASPIFGSFEHLPPILAFGGGHDILVTDARALKTKCPSTEYKEEGGMIHDWPIFTFPESKQAQKRMGEFVRECLE